MEDIPTAPSGLHGFWSSIDLFNIKYYMNRLMFISGRLGLSITLYYSICVHVLELSTCHMPQFCKIILSYFDFIPRHYVKFNAKL